MVRRVSIPEYALNFKPPFGPIGESVFLRSYSHNLEDGTKEDWAHTVVR